MKKVAHLALAALTTVSLVGLASPSADAATKWYCSGNLTKRCISHSGAKVTVKFSNTTSKSAKGQFGVTCAGPDGQDAKVLKDGTIPGYDTFSKSYTCPKGFRDHATGWQMSNGKVYRTPELKF
ncbi:hypothetical protein [Streptomyces sp. DSM 15324]|uniref:hypothetical protein n=1 Tax=Streptomyces sp. DSM 15324 TaxID=1739111 RepID=UPI00074AEB1C|nr:hypothetical protein [Streptomyces sp. DSM 15324]KUO13652.1 hypothetical protein AQJ58_00695 [Streptomyces sp. DSM 15324]